MFNKDVAGGESLSLMHAKQKLMWICYWATAVTALEKKTDMDLI